MLEFQEGFFEQEVREGFYLDATMKTVWAAELEVLQRVAEVCGRHGIQWYAAYGTLMGAIRHEGFVPWDDDMDIWVMRKDYNRLMTELLPKELPKGYIVQSAMNEFGYDQFHSCVINGEGIDITPSRLEEYHGCPFTVCLDIFPLDYLPRNEGERDVQKNLVELAGRAAMLAKELRHDDNDESEDEEVKKKQKNKRQSAIEEVMDAVEYLEGFCSFRLDRKYIEAKDWRKVASELWRCANYVAMMYGEEDADYIVEYLDFDRWSEKKFPKKWFEEVYSATFENFMVPIPCAYHEVLYTIYGSEYCRYIMGGGCHEYPFYKRQLVELREYVAGTEKKAIEVGIVKETDSPEEREFICAFGKLNDKKKKVLMANDPLLYCKNAGKQLDLLEQVLTFFKVHSDEVLLWWRPHPVMKSVLHSVDENLEKRYENLLDTYKKAGWGICDETTNTDRAVEECDIYYGDMNAIVQTFQNAQKPIMLMSQSKELAEQNNAGRVNRLRDFISYADYCQNGNRKIFANVNYNAMVVWNEDSEQVERFVKFPDDARATSNLHSRVISKNDKYLFLPVGNGNAHVLDSMNGTIRTIKKWEDDKAAPVSWGVHSDGETFFVIPSLARIGLCIWSFESECMEPVTWWNPEFEMDELFHGTIDAHRFYSLELHSNRLVITNVTKKATRMYKLPDNVVGNIAYDGQDFWYTAEETSELVQWNVDKGVIKRMLLPLSEESSIRKHQRYYLRMHATHGKIFLVPQMADKIFVYDIVSESFMCAAEFDVNQKTFSISERLPFFKETDQSILIILQGLAIQVKIDFETLQANIVSENYCLDESAQAYQKSVLFDRNALLFEEAEKYDLNLLLSYIREQ